MNNIYYDYFKIKETMKKVKLTIILLKITYTKIQNLLDMLKILILEKNYVENECNYKFV